MKITISGMIGAGKSTVAKELAKKLNYQHFSSGDFMRQLAKERGITLDEISKIAETNKSIDEEIDKRQVKFGKEKNNFVIDGRISWYFIPDSVKIYLDVSEEEAANRIWKDKHENRKNEGFNTKEELIKKIKERKASESKRYIKYYNIDHHNKKNYDIVIDTNNKPIQKVVEELLEKIKTIKEKKSL